MKRSLLLSIAASLTFGAFADLSGTGYYRVHNYKTNRYVSVVDDTGRIDYMNTTADLSAIKLQMNFDEVCCDPASVLKITPVGSEYQVETQGTGIYQIISHYLNLKANGSDGGKQLYNAYGQMNGIVKYLGDGSFFLSKDIGAMVTHAKGDYNKWYVTPIDEKGDNFFGIKPPMESAGKYYTSIYTSFPYTPYSEGIKVYYISHTHEGMIVLKEIEGTVPAGTPVIIECSTDSPSTNRVTVGGSASPVTDNKMKGVYFNCDIYGHINRVEYKKDTMRVLGVLSDGSIGFVKDEELEYIPVNSCYITVPKGSPDEYRVVSLDEYHADVDISEADDTPKDVYDIHGRIVLHNALPEQINSLQPGIYISGGKKWIVK